MKYYNPKTKTTAYSTELLIQGIDISNKSVLEALSWYELLDKNEYTYDKKSFCFVKSGIPQFDETAGVYYQDYLLMPITSIDKSEMLSNIKEKLSERISDSAYSNICKGFDKNMLVDGEMKLVHFSYDTIDQSNFSDAANLSMISTMKDIGIYTVDWNGYIDYTSSTDGQLVVFTLDAIEFLKLHATALKHKNDNIMLCKDIKSEIEASVSIEDLMVRMANYSVTVEV